MNRSFNNQFTNYIRVLQRSPSAVAEINGSTDCSDICGRVYFYQTNSGVLVAAQVSGLPSSDADCSNRIFAFHIHSGCSCTGNQNDPFANAGAHYNPDNCRHPNHAGDLLPLWGNDGYAFTVFLTDRFCVNDILGKTVIIHSNPDNFSTQPAGNAGQKIACGVIERFRS